MTPTKGAEHPGPAGAGRALVVVLVLSVAGAACWGYLGNMGFATPGPFSNIFDVLFRRHEGPHLALTACASILIWLVLRRRWGSPDARNNGRTILSRGGTLGALCLLGFLVALFGSRLLHLDIDLSMDEHLARFQARVFARGQVSAEIPGHMQPLASAMTPIFVTLSPDGARWYASDAPVFSLLRAAFLKAGMEAATNPALAALSLALLWSIARRIWPAEPAAPVIATGLLLASPQFLVTSMTGYSMSANLAANLGWLLLWLHPGRLAALVLPVLGGIALGIHTPFPHALFAAPFLAASVQSWPRWRLIYSVVVYLLFAGVWLAWFHDVHMLTQGGGSLLQVFGLPGRQQGLTLAMSVALIATWQVPFTVFGASLALVRFSQLESPVRLSLCGLALTIVFFLFYPSSQGHGWGYRYVYGSLGALVLAATDSAVRLRREVGPGVVTRALAVALALTLAVALPLRSLQVRAFCAPFAAGAELVRAIRAPAVLVDEAGGWYAQDLVRNDPFLETGPIVLGLRRLSPSRVPELTRLFGSRIPLIGRDQLASLGYFVPMRPESGPFAPPRPDAAGPNLEGAR